MYSIWRQCLDMQCSKVDMKHLPWSLEVEKPCLERLKKYVTRLWEVSWAKKWLSLTRKGGAQSTKWRLSSQKCHLSSFCSSKVCWIDNFIQFLCYCTSFWWKSSKISDQIITLERLFFIDFQDQSLSLFGECHGGEGGRDKRWQSVTRGRGGQK